uniref:Uncharacterized protein n=1 Tax=Anguilla anguilla TaxID=7936 RepID=A0A0E9UZS7_ANGAN
MPAWQGAEAVLPEGILQDVVADGFTQVLPGRIRGGRSSWRASRE